MVVAVLLFTGRVQGKGYGQKKDLVGSIQDRRLTMIKRKTLAHHKHGTAVRIQGDPSSITQHTLSYFLQEYGVSCS